MVTSRGNESRAQQALAAVGDVLSVIGQGDFALQHVLERLVARATELCDADWGYLFMREGEVFRGVATHAGRPESTAYEIGHPTPVVRTTLIGRVVLDERAVNIPDVLADPEYRWEEGQRLGGYRSLMGVPIRGEDGRIAAVLGLARSTVAPFTDEQVALISLFADQAAVAIRVGRLLGEEHAAAQREAAVREVLQAIARTSFELDDLLQSLVDRAVTLCRADVGNISRPDGNAFRIVAFTGFGGHAEYERLERERPYLPERGSATGRALLTREVVHIPDVLADPDYALKDLQALTGFRTLLAVPLLREGHTIGVISVGRNEVRPFSDQEIGLVQTFADQAVVAIENVRLFEMVERQRSELARFAPQVASLLTSAEGEQLLAGHRREITALFCDLRGFTAFAETAEPEEVLGVLREYHSAVGELAVTGGGTVEHFAGDGLMVFFNDPLRLPDHALAATRTALAIRGRFEELAAGWRKRGYELGLGVGVAVGYATLGRIGFPGRYDYGGVGNVVILASRLSDAAEAGQVLLSQRAFAAVEEQVEAEAVEPLTLKGFSRPVPAYAVRAVRGPIETPLEH